jgi:hypothetical protein
MNYLILFLLIQSTSLVAHANDSLKFLQGKPAQTFGFQQISPGWPKQLQSLLDLVHPKKSYALAVSRPADYSIDYSSG